MRLSQKPLTIDDFDGFIKNDTFGYQIFAKKFMNMLGGLEDSQVVILDAPWGTGKTTFIKQWCGLLRQNAYPVIYFDSFANDYIEDVFQALLGEILIISAELPKNQNDPVEKFFDKSVEIAKKIAPAFVKSIGVHYIKKAIGEEASSILDKETLISEMSDLQSEYLKECFQKQKEQKDVVKEFHKTLQDILKPLNMQAKTKAKDKGFDPNTDTDKPLIFIVDELDRCKPTYALKVLETIKHFFNVDKIHFVLVTNLQQLQTAVTKEYGCNRKNANVYLQKFYTLNLALPENSEVSKQEKYIDYLFNEYKQEYLAYKNFETHLNWLKSFANEKLFNLREINHSLSMIILLLVSDYSCRKMFSDCYDYNKMFLATQFVCIRIKNQNLYGKIKSADNLYPFYGEIIDYVEISGKGGFIERINISSSIYWKTLCGIDLTNEDIENMQRHQISIAHIDSRFYNQLSQILDSLEISQFNSAMS